MVFLFGIYLLKFFKRALRCEGLATIIDSRNVHGLVFNHALKCEGLATLRLNVMGIFVSV